MRSNRSHTGNRRSHHGLIEPRVSTCSNCGAKHLRHRVCSECGHYRGRLVIDVALKATKKAEKMKMRERERGAGVAQGKDEAEKEKTLSDSKRPLSPEGLSKK